MYNETVPIDCNVDSTTNIISISNLGFMRIEDDWRVTIKNARNPSTEGLTNYFKIYATKSYDILSDDILRSNPVITQSNYHFAQASILSPSSKYNLNCLIA